MITLGVAIFIGGMGATLFGGAATAMRLPPQIVGIAGAVGFLLLFFMYLWNVLN